MKEPTENVGCISGYVAIRRNRETGHLWLDTSTYAWSAEAARERAALSDAKIPEWAKGHPVVDTTCVVMVPQSITYKLDY